MDEKFKKKVTDFSSTLTSITGLIGAASGSCELQAFSFLPTIFEKRILNLIEKNENYNNEIYSELKKLIEETCNETYDEILKQRSNLADFFKDVSMRIMYDYETISSINDISHLVLQKITTEKTEKNIYNITHNDVAFLNNVFLHNFQKNLSNCQKLYNFLNTNDILKNSEFINSIKEDLNHVTIKLNKIEKDIEKSIAMTNEFNENIKADVGVESHKEIDESTEMIMGQNEKFVTSKFTVINNGCIGTQKTVNIETVNGNINL